MKFISKVFPADTTIVTGLDGEDAVHRPYAFTIDLASTVSKIDTAQLLSSASRLEFTEDASIHGLVCRVGRLDRGPDGWFRYRVILVPRLWKGALQIRTRVFLKKSLPKLLPELLKECGLTEGDYQLSLPGDHPERAYVVQYRETDLEFLSRLCESEGVSFRFVQGESAERVLFGDSDASFDSRKPKELNYRSPWSVPAESGADVIGFQSWTGWIPEKLEVRSHHDPTPDVEFRAIEETKGKPAFGTAYEYGGRFADVESVKKAAAIRAQEWSARQTQFTGSSRIPDLAAGTVFQLTGHDDGDRDFLITRVRHRANLPSEGKSLRYWNHFSCVEAGHNFRPPRATAVPAIPGAIVAHVEGPKEGQYAEVDQDGRYRVRVNFDGDGGESHWIRMAQPYAGAGMGMHLPLHKGTEVMLAHVNGDPDQPFIVGAIPNGATPGPVSNKNHTQAVIHTGGGNSIVVEDLADAQSVTLESPTGSSVIRIGKIRPKSGGSA